MKKQSFILAVAFATFTLTACGEKTQTPEEMKMVAIKNGEEAEKTLHKLPQKNTFNDYTQEEIKTFDSLVEIANKGRMASDSVSILMTFEQAKKSHEKTMRRINGTATEEEIKEWERLKEAVKAARNSGK